MSGLQEGVGKLARTSLKGAFTFNESECESENLIPKLSMLIFSVRYETVNNS